MRRISYLFFAAVVTILYSCEEEDSVNVAQDRIASYYEVAYNANTDVTRVLASFRFGENALGTPLELTEPANVLFNDQVLPYNRFALGHAVDLAGEVETGTFIYTNNEGTEYRNSIPSYDTIAFPVDFDTLSKSSASTLTWEGEPLGPDELVSVFLFDTDTEDALFITSTEGATSVILPRDQIERLTLGQNTFRMERRKEISTVDGTPAGGNFIVKYRAKQQVVTITE